MLSPSVMSLKLGLPGEPLTFRAGQWINLFVPHADGPIKRAYSIASAPQERTIELAVTRVEHGRASPIIHTLKPGDDVAIDGPHGLFTRDDPSEAAIFVATGTGLSPFRSMLLDELARSRLAPLTLLFGARTQADLLYRAQLEQIARAHAQFRYEVTLSRPDPGWTGRGGYVQTHLAALVRELGAPHVYVCGLTKMVVEVRALLKGELGYDRKRIHSERYD